MNNLEQTNVYPTVTKTSDTEPVNSINSGDKGAGMSRLTRMERIRRELTKLAQDTESGNLDRNSIATRLRGIRDELRNRKAVRNGTRVVSNPMTDKLRTEIREFATMNPTLTFAEIGAHFKVNGARVSEIMAGLRS